MTSHWGNRSGLSMRTFPQGAVATGVTAQLGANELAKSGSFRPNIVYLHSHDSGRYLQPYGQAVATPNLQRLAQGGAHCSGRPSSPLQPARPAAPLYLQGVILIAMGCLAWPTVGSL